MSVTSAPTLDDELVNFLQAGHPIQVATRNNFNKPSYTRSWGCKVNDDRRSMVLFLYRSYAHQALENLRNNGVYAAAFISVMTYECYQLKGSGAEFLDDLAPYRSVLEHFEQQQYQLMANIGLSEAGVHSMAGRSVDDYVPVYCPIDACYRQTPGPGAGEKVNRA